MATHNKLGKEGEEEAVAFLIEHGYQIRDRNWHCGRKELDIVAECQGELIIIEVKTRSNDLFGNPEEAVNTQKIRRIIASTDAYLRQYELDLPVRFDIISITGVGETSKIKHIINAFYAPIW